MTTHDDLVCELHAATALSWAGPGWRGVPLPGTEPSVLPPGGLWRPGSLRSFAGEPDVDLVEAVVIDAYGALDGRRNVPSAGALYPLDFHLTSTAGGPLLDWSASGRLIPRSDEPVSGTVVRQAVFEQIEGQARILFISADPTRCAARYGVRAYRFLLIETGMVAQELVRACARRDLGVCALGAFDDDAVRTLLGFELTARLPLLALAIGWSAAR